MERPYVIAHMLTAMDGKIDGAFFSAPETSALMPAYAEIRKQYQCQAVLNGAATAAEIYADGFLPRQEGGSHAIAREDCIFEHPQQNFIIVADGEGRLAWRDYRVIRNDTEYQVAVIVMEDVPDSYLKKLQELEISYIFAGIDNMDFSRALRKLYQYFRIERIMTTGGGIMNWSLLQAGCLDEVSLVVSPVSDGMTDSAGIFDRSPFVSRNRTKAFRLIKAEKLEHDGLWLVYRTK